MSPTTVPSSKSGSVPGTDERREWIRIDDRVLLEYRLLSESSPVPSSGVDESTADMIASAVTKPTADLLARSGDALAGSPVLSWIMKIDYLLEVILNSLATVNPSSIAMAKLTDVNLSGGGVGFVSAREFAVNDQLALKLILPPFTLIQTVAKVIRAVPHANGQGYSLATEFIDLKADDQEHLIRHILQTQAERLRARRKSAA